MYHAVSLSKGCYVGQETLAKVHNKDAVKQQLWGLRVSREVAVGAPVTAGEQQTVLCEGRIVRHQVLYLSFQQSSHNEQCVCRGKADWNSHQRS
jgi:folate-binding Fe-S cluster repair protein YgfZ